MFYYLYKQDPLLFIHLLYSLMFNYIRFLLVERLKCVKLVYKKR